MSGETESNISGWTTDTLHSHLMRMMDAADRRYEQRFGDQEKAVNAALIAAKEAVVKAEAAAEKRFDAANEFRGQLSDQAATFMPRKEAESSFAALRDLIDRNAASVTVAVNALAANDNQRTGERVAQTETRGMNQWVIATVLSVLFLFFTAASFVIYLLAKP